MDKIRKKALRCINNRTLLATVDMGKRSFTGYLRCPDGQEVPSTEFPNTRVGLTRFWAVLVQTQQAHGLDQIVLGYESTGCYAEPLVHFFQDKPVRLEQVNPKHTKRVKELADNSPQKSDGKDPEVIADILALGHGLTVVVPQGAAAELRRLTGARERALTRRTALYNQLHDLVFLLFPELLQLLPNLQSKSVRYLLRHYPTPAAVVAAGIPTLTAHLRRVSHGKVTPSTVRAVVIAARQSIGLQAGQHGLTLELRAVLDLVDATDQFVAQVEAAMGDYLARIPYSRALLSLKGIGPVTVAGVIGEVGDFRQYPSQKAVLKFAGLNLFELSSGQHRGRRRISKRGRAVLRKLLYFAALNTVRNGGIMHAVYQRHRQKGMPKLKALLAIARKLLGIMLALARSQEPFAPYSKEDLPHAA
jgi:transposase